jgi:hypothetical protein
MRADALLELAMTDERFWRHQVPSLVMGERLSARAAPAPLAAPLERSLASLATEGYFTDACATLGELAPRIREAVERLHAVGLPGVFVFLFDEPWECYYALDPMLRAVLGGGYRMMPNFWVWHIDPKAGEAGWDAHRDRGRIALDQHGAPLALTTWVPLSTASIDNGCIHVVPANEDPLYATDAELDWIDPPEHARALPVSPGEYLCWNQALLHWGGKSRPTATEPRISMAFEFQRGDVPPFSTAMIEPLRNPTFDARLRLVAEQLLRYGDLHALPNAILDPARRVLGR